jgi:hypothetical protein
MFRVLPARSWCEDELLRQDVFALLAGGGIFMRLSSMSGTQAGGRILMAALVHIITDGIGRLPPPRHAIIAGAERLVYHHNEDKRRDEATCLYGDCLEK